MSRKFKNVTMILVVVAILLSMIGTAYYAKNHSSGMGNEQNMNGQMPGGMENGMGETGEPPEKPDGESSDDMGEAPEKPDGESEDGAGEVPDMPNGQMDNNMNQGSQTNNTSKLSYVYYIAFGTESLILSITLAYLIMSKFNKKTFKETFKNSDKAIILVLWTIIFTAVFTIMCILLSNKYVSQMSNDNQGGMGEMGGNNENADISYSSQNEITSDEKITSGEYSSSTEDENALLVNGDINVTISNISINKTGDSNGGDNTSFYGINSAIIAKSGANLTLKNITVTTNATGANGVFCYGGSATTNNSSNDGTTITISDSTITTKKDNSGGIMTTGGGTTIASNLTVTTAGISSAAIRSDRGGGTVTVDGGTYTTTGAGSPSIYSTADITVKNATLISKLAEGIVIEGKNKVTIENTTLTDSNTKLNGQSTTYKNIFLYQSMSGDAASGTAEFTAKESTITTNNGDTLYVTNTTASINLENNTIKNNDSSGNFLRVQKDSWGNSGSNGGDVTLTLTKQKATGNIVIDSISTLSMNMTSGSYYEGTINGDNTAKKIELKLDKTSKIKLTGDSYITSLDNADTSNTNIDFNGYKLYVDGKEYK